MGAGRHCGGLIARGGHGPAVDHGLAVENHWSISFSSTQNVYLVTVAMQGQFQAKQSPTSTIASYDQARTGPSRSCLK